MKQVFDKNGLSIILQTRMSALFSKSLFHRQL